jgi:hypothetical protein
MTSSFLWSRASRRRCMLSILCGQRRSSLMTVTAHGHYSWRGAGDSQQLVFTSPWATLSAPGKLKIVSFFLFCINMQRMEKMPGFLSFFRVDDSVFIFWERLITQLEDRSLHHLGLALCNVLYSTCYFQFCQLIISRGVTEQLWQWSPCQLQGTSLWYASRLVKSSGLVLCFDLYPQF